MTCCTHIAWALPQDGKRKHMHAHWLIFCSHHLEILLGCHLADDLCRSAPAQSSSPGLRTDDHVLLSTAAQAVPDALAETGNASPADLHHSPPHLLLELQSHSLAVSLDDPATAYESASAKRHYHSMHHYSALEPQHSSEERHSNLDGHSAAAQADTFISEPAELQADVLLKSQEASWDNPINDQRHDHHHEHLQHHPHDRHRNQHHPQQQEQRHLQQQSQQSFERSNGHADGGSMWEDDTSAAEAPGQDLTGQTSQQFLRKTLRRQDLGRLPDYSLVRPRTVCHLEPQFKPSPQTGCAFTSSPHAPEYIILDAGKRILLKGRLQKCCWKIACPAHAYAGTSQHMSCRTERILRP